MFVEDDTTTEDGAEIFMDVVVKLREALNPDASAGNRALKLKEMRETAVEVATTQLKQKLLSMHILLPVPAGQNGNTKPIVFQKHGQPGEYYRELGKYSQPGMDIFKVQYGGLHMDEPIVKKGSNAIYDETNDHWNVTFAIQLAPYTEQVDGIYTVLNPETDARQEPNDAAPGAESDDVEMADADVTDADVTDEDKAEVEATYDYVKTLLKEYLVKKTTMSYSYNETIVDEYDPNNEIFGTVSGGTVLSFSMLEPNYEFDEEQAIAFKARWTSADPANNIEWYNNLSRTMKKAVYEMTLSFLAAYKAGAGKGELSKLTPDEIETVKAEAAGKLSEEEEEEDGDLVEYSDEEEHEDEGEDEGGIDDSSSDSGSEPELLEEGEEGEEGDTV